MISVGGQALDGSGERFHLPERDQECIEIVTRDLAATRDVCCNERPSASRSLEQT
jgi:hypothetical protein